MATIIEFETRVKEMNYVCDSSEELPEDWTAEIIIFPGIRIERHTGFETTAEISQG